MKQLEHAREVQSMVEDRRRLYQEQKAREEAEIAAQSAEEVGQLACLNSWSSMLRLWEWQWRHTNWHTHLHTHTHTTLPGVLASVFQARKQVILESERHKLLREAAELKEFLPRGVLRDQSDIDYINSVLAGTSLA